MQAGAVLLVGGRSTRMGQPKAALDWHGEPLAARVARVLRRAVPAGPVVAVGAPGQPLPALPHGIEVVADPVEGDGPLRGLTVGLAALQGRADVAFVSSVDAPLLHAGFVRAVLTALDDESDVAVPVAHGHRHPLSAAYRVGLVPLAEALLESGERRLTVLLARARTRFLEEDELRRQGGLRETDPELDALRNVNTPGDYDAARRLEAPTVTVAPTLEVRARRLETALAAAGLSLDGHVMVTVNGEAIVPDPWFPLASGDRIALRPAGGKG